jgi:hypothetical protein
MFIVLGFLILKMINIGYHDKYREQKVRQVVPGTGLEKRDQRSDKFGIL